jgi:plasmid stability protein
MAVMLQVRNLPDDVHAKLKARAAKARMSLSDYVANELARIVEYRSNAEVVADFRASHPDIRVASDAIASATRDAREERGLPLSTL